MKIKPMPGKTREHPDTPEIALIQWSLTIFTDNI